MARINVVSGWTAMTHGSQYLWGGGVGTFASENAAAVTFHSKPPHFTDFVENTDIGIAAGGGMKNFVLPRGTIIEAEQSGASDGDDINCMVAPSGQGNDLRPIQY